MRRVGYRVVDLLVEYLDDTSRPPLRRATPDEMAERLSAPAPNGPEDLTGSARARHEAERLADPRLAVAPGTDVGARISA